jgi:hypothetical protein
MYVFRNGARESLCIIGHRGKLLYARLYRRNYPPIVNQRYAKYIIESSIHTLEYLPLI